MITHREILINCYQFYRLRLLILANQITENKQVLENI